MKFKDKYKIIAKSVSKKQFIKSLLDAVSSTEIKYSKKEYRKYAKRAAKRK